MIQTIVILCIIVIILCIVGTHQSMKIERLEKYNEYLNVKAKAFDHIHYRLDDEFDELCTPNKNLPWELYEYTRQIKREAGDD